MLKIVGKRSKQRINLSKRNRAGCRDLGIAEKGSERGMGKCSFSLPQGYNGRGSSASSVASSKSFPKEVRQKFYPVKEIKLFQEAANDSQPPVQVRMREYKDGEEKIWEEEGKAKQSHASQHAIYLHSCL